MKLRAVYWKNADGSIKATIRVMDQGDFPTSNIFGSTFEDPADKGWNFREGTTDSITKTLPTSDEATQWASAKINALKEKLDNWRNILVPEPDAVGTLKALRVYMKEVASTYDYLFGTLGRYVTWLLTPKKAIMLFQFVATFKCDLKKARVEPIDEGERKYRIVLPAPSYDVLMKDFIFHDTQGAKVLRTINLPALIDLDTLDKADKNKLRDEQKNQAIKAVEEDLAKWLDQASVSVSNTLQQLVSDFGVSLDVQFAQNSQNQQTVALPEVKVPRLP